MDYKTGTDEKIESCHIEIDIGVYSLNPSAIHYKTNINKSLHLHILQSGFLHSLSFI